MNKKLLLVNWSTLSSSLEKSGDLVRYIFREAKLHRCGACELPRCDAFMPKRHCSPSSELVPFGAAAVNKEYWSHRSALIFFDECENFFESRQKNAQSCVTAFLAELERFDSLIIMATNRAYDLDEVCVCACVCVCGHGVRMLLNRFPCSVLVSWFLTCVCVVDTVGLLWPSAGG